MKVGLLRLHVLAELARELGDELLLRVVSCVGTSIVTSTS